MLVEPPPSVDSSSASETVTTNRRDNRVSKKHPSIRELVHSLLLVYVVCGVAMVDIIGEVKEEETEDC